MSGPAFADVTLFIAKNEDWGPQSFILQTSDETPVPIDLTDSTFELQIKRFEEDATALVSISTGDGITIEAPAEDGRFTVMITMEKVQRLADDTDYMHDLIWTNADGLRKRVWAGTATVTSGVTRS